MNCGTMIIQLKVAEVTHIVSSAEGSTTISWVEEDWFPRHAKSNSVIWAETWNAETLARISTRRKGRCCKLRNEPKRKWDKKVSEGLGEIEIFTGRIKGNEKMVTMSFVYRRPGTRKPHWHDNTLAKGQLIIGIFSVPIGVHVRINLYKR